MSIRLPPLNALRTFEAAARHGSFVGAANELALTPSAISHRIRQLEDRLGVKLFERRPRDVVLTERGRLYLETIQDAFERITTGTDRLLGRATRNTLTVGGCAAMCLHWLLPRLDRFHRQHPRVEVRIASRATAEALNDGSLDVLLSLGAPPVSGLRAVRLFTDRLVVVGTADYFCRAGWPDQVADLKEHVVFGEQDPANAGAQGFPGPGWGRWLQAAGAPRLTPRRVYLCDTPFACIEAALAGQGLAIGWRRLLAPYLERGTLLAPFNAEVESERPFVAVTGPATRVDVLVHLFLDWIVAEASGMGDPTPAPPVPAEGQALVLAGAGPAGRLQ